MKKLYLLIFLVLFVISASLATFKQDFSQVEIRTEKVAGNVYLLRSNVAGNIGLSVGEDGVLMVDDQFAPLSDKIRAAIKKLGGDSPRYILNTHHHRDHTGGNPKFSAESTIIAHTNVRKRLASEPKEAWPVITFDESLSVHMNGEEIKAVHFPPGHTDGDAVIYFTGSNVVHMGDDFFAGRFPFVDLDGGGSVEGLIQNVKKILDDLPPGVKIIPGHGPVSGRKELQAYYDMLVGTSEVVKKQMVAGKTLDEIKKQGLPSRWDAWSWRFVSAERWIETIYKSAQNSKKM
ncbi:MAG: MBL fold metallo-hydrolase [Calditrichaeota bacterium]|nr:MAG: MBL fold metallo-hydrolase [Calditrichota bacterium]